MWNAFTIHTNIHNDTINNKCISIQFEDVSVHGYWERNCSLKQHLLLSVSICFRLNFALKFALRADKFTKVSI